MSYKKSSSWKIFMGFNYVLLSVVALVCLFPMLHILAVSLSEGWAVQSGMVGIWPVKFTFKAYEFVMNKPEFAEAFLVTMKRVVLGVPLTMLMNVLVAYPLSKRKNQFKYRNAYTWFSIGSLLSPNRFNTVFSIIRKWVNSS